DAVRREGLEHAREDADLVAHAEQDRGLVVAGRPRGVVRREHHEARQVAGLVVDRRGEHGKAVGLRRSLARERRDPLLRARSPGTTPRSARSLSTSWNTSATEAAER